MTSKYIPKGWKQVSLGEIAEQIMYGMNSSAIEYDGKHKYIRITDIDELTHEFLPKPLTTPSGEIEDRFMLKSGDIVFARTGASVGKTYLYNEKDGDLYFAGFLIKFSINKAYPAFIYYQTLLKTYDNWVKSISVRSGQPGINAEEYKSFLILLPPLPEQHRIVAVLETWDKTIELLNRKIQIKKNIKKGLMQKLLTGELRLPGFSGEWGVVRLGSVCKIKKGTSFTKNELVEGSIPVIAGGQQPAYFHNQSNRTGDTITVSASGAYAGFVGFYKTPIFASDCSTIQEETADLKFICTVLKLKQTWLYHALQVGGAQPHVYPKDLEKLKVTIPKSKQEQTAIAQILTTADTEIEALEKKKQILEDQKKFLLNNLITGQIRTPENLTLVTKQHGHK